MVAENLPVEEVAGIKEMFEKMDTDKNGNLTLKELKEGLQNYGSQVGDPDVQMLMDAVSALSSVFLIASACNILSRL